LILAGVGEELSDQLAKTGLSALLGKESIYLDDAAHIGRSAALAYAEAVRWLTSRGVAFESPSNPLLTAVLEKDDRHRPAGEDLAGETSAAGEQPESRR
jgi:hypothetical protein